LTNRIILVHRGVFDLGSEDASEDTLFWTDTATRSKFQCTVKTSFWQQLIVRYVSRIVQRIIQKLTAK